jgi:hypothetical protein
MGPRSNTGPRTALVASEKAQDADLPFGCKMPSTAKTIAIIDDESAGRVCKRARHNAPCHWRRWQGFFVGVAITV